MKDDSSATIESSVFNLPSSFTSFLDIKSVEALGPYWQK
jgi:hypothetical protein